MRTANDKIRSSWINVVYHNDVKAFEQFFHLLQPKLMRFCLQYLSNHELSEEIVSDIFVECWLRKQDLKHILDPEIYFLIAVKNRALDELKKRTRLTIVDVDEEIDQLYSNDRPDLALEKKELRLNLDKAIDSLPFQCKLIFRMVKEDGMKCAEVAKVLDISVRTVHTQIYRAINKLDKTMGMYVNHDAQAKIINFISVGVTFILFFF